MVSLCNTDHVIALCRPLENLDYINNNRIRFRLKFSEVNIPFLICNACINK